MNKVQYLNELSQHLRRLPKSEVEEILLDYEEHFQMGIESGKTEEQIARKLGSPRVVASAFLIHSTMDENLTEMSTKNMTGTALRGIGLLFLLAPFNFLILCGPAVVIAALLFAGWAVIGAGFFSSSAAYFEFVTTDALGTISQFTNWSLFFMYLGVIGICLMATWILFQITRGTLIGFLNYLKWNFNLITNKSKGSFA